MRDITLGDTFYHAFTTRAFATGIPGTLGGTPVLSVLEENNATPITAGVSVSVDRGSVTGLNEATIVATSGNGYENGKSYSIYISTGTVDSVSAVGEVVGQFTVGASAAAVDLANGTDGLGALKTLIDALNDISTADVLAQVIQGLKDGGFLLSSSTIATVTSQTKFIIPATDDAPDDNAYNDLTAVFIDGTDSNQVSVRSVVNYVGSTREVEVDEAPDFTITTADTLILLSGSNARAIWNRLLTGSTHNRATSAGRRLRGIQEFQGYEDGAVWIDTVNGTAGTTNFENGTVENPVDSIADANTIAASLGLAVFHVISGSSITFAASQDNQVFKGSGWTLALGGQSIDGTTIVGADVSGVATNTSGRQFFVDCFVGAVTLPGDTHVIGSGIAGTQTLGEAGDFFYDNCHSAIAGTATPVLDFGGALNASNVSFRHYSGGIEIQNMGAGTGSYTMSLEGFGQLVINANCSATSTVALRGTFTVTDNAGGAVTLSDDARIDVGNVADGVLDEALSGHQTQGTAGAAITMAAYLGPRGPGVYIDDAAANTGTTLGDDGTLENPVSTIAAATTVAEALGVKRFYLVDNSAITLAQAYEDYEVIGIGVMNQVTLGSQDVDNAIFHNVVLTGTQGGTQFMRAVDCQLQAILSAEILADDCWLTGDITLRAASNHSFGGCKSGVPGGGTPDLTFPGSGTTTVNFRHYSGGLTVKSATANDTMSYETDGQLVIDATCTSLTIHVRGNCTITDSGTTTALTQDAAVTRTSINAEVDTALSDYDPPTKAEMDTAHALLATPAQVASELGTYDGPTKGEMDTAHALLATPSQVATELATYDGPTKGEMDTAHALLATPTQVKTQVDAGFTTQMADSVPAVGTIPTREQTLYMLAYMRQEFSIAGTTMTVKKADGSTTLITLTLDDATNPTSLTRAT